MNITAPIHYRHNQKLMFAYAKLLALAVRILMKMGFVVLIIGHTRSGKSLILESATPGKVICKLNQASSKAKITVDELPSGNFSIDEVSIYDQNQLAEVIESVSNRTFAISLQNESDLKEYALTSRLKNRRKLVLRLC